MIPLSNYRVNKFVSICATLCLISAVCLARGGGGGFGAGGRGGGGGFGGGGRSWGGGGDSFRGGSVRYSGGDFGKSSGRSDWGGGDYNRSRSSDSGGDRSSYRTESRSNRDFSGSRENRSYDRSGDRSFNNTERRTYTPNRDYSSPQRMSNQTRNQERNFSVPPSNMGSVRYRNMSNTPSNMNRSFDRTRPGGDDRRINNNTRPGGNDRHNNNVRPNPNPGPKPGPGPHPGPGPKPGPRPGPGPHPYHPGPYHPGPHPGPGWHYPPPYWHHYPYNGWNYWRWNNHWYRPYYYCGSTWYFSVAAPIGIYIDALPPVSDYQVVVLGGTTYYVINDDYYVQSVQNGKTVYVTTQAPAQTSAAPAVTPSPQGDGGANPFDLMDNMSNFLSMQDTFTVSVEDTYDEPSSTGAMVQKSSIRTVYLKRPSEMAVVYDGDDGNSRLLYNGVSLYSINLTSNVFSSASMPSTIDAMLDTMSQTYGINLPLADFLYSNPGRAMLAGVRSGQYVGMSIINGVTCNHLAFTGDGVDWEIWIRTGKQPLPEKLLIIYKNVEGKPRYTMTVNSWKLGSVPNGAFNLNIPQNAKQVEMLPIQQAEAQTEDAPTTQPASTAAASTASTTTQPNIMPGPPPPGAVPLK